MPQLSGHTLLCGDAVQCDAMYSAALGRITRDPCLSTAHLRMKRFSLRENELMTAQSQVDGDSISGYVLAQVVALVSEL
jgi:hypothetical protein